MAISEREIREIVHQCMVEERKANVSNLDNMMLKAVSAILTSFGIEDDERVEIRQDFQYLRRWRKGAERVTNAGIVAIVTVVIGGVASAVWIGFRSLVGK